MLTKDRVEEILAQVEAPVGFMSWWRVMEKGDGFLVQLCFDAPDNDNPEVMKENHGRKWYVSSHCTETEAVGTALAAFERAHMHEIRELFKYKGRRIANPHFHVDALIDLVDAGQLDNRPDDN